MLNKTEPLRPHCVSCWTTYILQDDTWNLQCQTSEMAYTLVILGAFAKLRKVTVNFVMSVHLHVRSPARTEQLGSSRTNFHEIRYLSIFRKSIDKVQVSLKPANNNSTLRE